MADWVRVVATSSDEFIAQPPQGPGGRAIFEERSSEAEGEVFRGLAEAWVGDGARIGNPGDVVEREGFDRFTLMVLDGPWKIAALAVTSADRGRER